FWFPRSLQSSLSCSIASLSSRRNSRQVKQRNYFTAAPSTVGASAVQLVRNSSPAHDIYIRVRSDGTEERQLADIGGTLRCPDRRFFPYFFCTALFGAATELVVTSLPSAKGAGF